MENDFKKERRYVSNFSYIKFNLRFRKNYLENGSSAGPRGDNLAVFSKCSFYLFRRRYRARARMLMYVHIHSASARATC